jgi:hypothetical protein
VTNIDLDNNEKAAGLQIMPFFTVTLAILVALAAALILWQPYASTVFFETVRAGFVACFG